MKNKRINSRTKGHHFERLFVGLLKILGYHAVTSRSESRALDDKGVDIVTNAPFNFQLKHVEKLQPGYHDILQSMPTDKVPVVVHKRNHKGVVVAMKLKDFEDLLLNKHHKDIEL